MTASMTRRTALIAAPALLLPVSARQSVAASVDAERRLAELEARHDGRLGVVILDTGTDQRIGHRADERFAMCSTFKCLAAACVLARVDRGEERLDRRVTYGDADLVSASPATTKHVADGMTIGELCEAAITLSDNTAGNLLLGSFGGPAALTAFARTLGDTVTRLDRIETALNEATPGDPRDTTSPAAMAGTLGKVALGDALSAPSRERLIGWLVGNKTGGKRLRAGLPAAWRVGDKTGNGMHAAANDIGVIWPPGREPIIATVYYAESTAGDEERNSVIADVGRLISDMV